MAEIRHPAFGTLTLDAAQGGGISWEGTRPLPSGDVAIDLTVMGPVDPARGLVAVAGAFVSGLAAFDEKAREALSADAEDGPDSAVTLYIEHHLEELDAKDVAALFGKPADAVDTEAFLAKVVLRRVGLCPDEPERTAVFDYSIVGDLTQYLLVVTFDADGEVVGVDMES